VSKWDKVGLREFIKPEYKKLHERIRDEKTTLGRALRSADKYFGGKKQYREGPMDNVIWYTSRLYYFGLTPLKGFRKNRKRLIKALEELRQKGIRIRYLNIRRRFLNV